MKIYNPAALIPTVFGLIIIVLVLFTEPEKHELALLAILGWAVAAFAGFVMALSKFEDGNTNP